MKRLIAFITGLALSIPAFALATPVSWDYTSNVLRPLSSMWTKEVKVPYLTATSTATSTLPYLTSTNLAVTGKLYGAGSPGASGAVLQSTGIGVQWVATSTLYASLGTVTSVAMTVPTGLAISGSPITTTGTLALTLDTGYTIPTTTRMGTWDTAYGWGNHASAGYLTGNQTITLSGDVTGSGATSITTAVADDSHAHTSTTLSGIDISDDTNLSADGTEIVLTGDALSLGTALTFTTGTSTTSFFTGTASSTSLYAKAVNFGASILSLVADTITGLGIWDLGGATSFEIPNGASPTVDATGEIALDTTYGQLKYFDGGTTHVLTGTSTRSFSIASTTSGTGGSFSTATTTFLLANDPEAITLIGWYCMATTTGSVSVRFGDGTNWTNASNCSTGGTTYATSNNTFTSFENFQVQIGSSASSPNRVTITTFTSKTAQ